MIRNYYKIAFRNLLKNKGYSAINIGGLAVGMAVAILIGLWLYDELSFNRYHTRHGSIAQVMTRFTGTGEHGINNSMPYPLFTELKNHYQNNFNNLVRVSWRQDYILSAGDKKISRKGQFWDKEAPDMLSLKMIHGSHAGLADPYSIMLSATTAKSLFGDQNPVNRTLKMNNKIDVRVTGVYEDMPMNSHFNEVKFVSPFDLWLTQNTWIEERATQDWSNHFLTIYAEIKPEDNFSKVSTIIKDAELKNLTNYKDQAAQRPQVFLHPMDNWHLHGFNRGAADAEPVRLVWTVGIIGAFVLLLACINFMNLSTARSEKRAKEVGIRKAIGSLRTQLVNQFLSESLLVVLIAFVFAILMATALLSWFNDLAAKQMSMLWGNPYFWLSSLSFVLVTGLLAGSYPALYLSAFQPVKVLKGAFRVGRFATIPRKVLVVMQFTVSVTLIISTIVIIRQIQIAKNRPVGYTRDGLIMLRMVSDDFYGKYDLLRDELKATGAVSEMSESMGTVTNVASGNSGFEWKNGNAEQDFGTLAVTHEHGKTVGWQFIKGRDFSREIATDSSGIVINEAAMKFMKLENPIGEPVRWKWYRGDKVLDYKILGVIKNMIMESPYDAIEPTIFFVKGHNGGVDWINIKMNPNMSTSKALPRIEAVFKKLIPSAPFDYQFVDEEYAKKFAREERIGKLATFFAALAIFISCLGLFGLASFVAEQRTKEIGIRKVLGASIANLWQLLSKDFVFLVILSCLISGPVAYFLMNSWLEKYTYRTEISWWIFAASGIGALAITLLTVSYQAIRAALLDPVRSLQSE
ncbi:ABC transporter permease [Dyadobacter pollutisoli]|uniref:ABC transporter permease n=1 Tax=Dyadobacter pollutisoli TaxID=2910158 RepID=A0A9E8N6B7_9BACT|nr:FtsX-like permease family protein [Dyadobacter pollutisoli]WAC10610.1 ABC transporter permease [Dyadobacter pollutisoli]